MPLAHGKLVREDEFKTPVWLFLSLMVYLMSALLASSERIKWTADIKMGRLIVTEQAIKGFL